MKLNAVIAIEKGVKARAHETLSALHKIAQKPAAFEGLVREYQPADDEGEKLPGERKVVQVSVSELLTASKLAVGDLIDVEVQKDVANTKASAPIVVDGVPLTDALPVTSLLFLEKQVTDLRTFIGALPELDIGEAWHRDENSGLYQTDPVQTHRTKKVQKPLVLFPATDKHPAQTQIITEDVIAGYWKTVRHSGAIAKPIKQAMIDRANKLLIGIKTAREQANDIAADQKPAVGAMIFDFLLKGDGAPR
jgi:hypothetical protein